MTRTREQEPIVVEPHAEGAQRRLESEVAIDAPPEAVWRALTEADELTRWFPPQARVEPGAGGSIWMSWGGQTEGTNPIEIWEPNRHLRTVWSEPGAPVKLAVDFHLEGAGGRTVLRLVHHGFTADAQWDGMYDGIRRGWSYELRSLRHYLERHRGSDRRIARADRAIGELSIAEAFQRLLSARGLAAEGSLGGLVEGDRYAVTTAGGDRLEGTVGFREEPTDLALLVDNWNDGLLRLGIERWGGPETPLEAHLWLATWGVPAARVAALQERWETLLAGALG
jgi:uncharacterized protein YndB with AHSA1/START domain